MSKLSFISPPVAAGSSKNSPPVADSKNIQPAEKFQAVMERLTELFSRANLSAPTGPTDLSAELASPKNCIGKTGQDTAKDGLSPLTRPQPELTTISDVSFPPAILTPAAAELATAEMSLAVPAKAGAVLSNPSAKTQTSPANFSAGQSPEQNITGKTGPDTAKQSGPPLRRLQSELTTKSAVLISPAIVMPAAVELATAGMPVAVAVKAGAVPSNSPARPETALSGVMVVESGPEKPMTTTELAPATSLLSQLLGEADDGPVASAKNKQTDSPVAAVNGPADLLASVQKSGPAQSHVDLPEALAPGVVEAPATGAARSGNEISAAIPGEKSPETQGQPATIAIQAGPILEAVPALAAPPCNAGTVVAKQEPTMKMASNKTNFSELEQKLPGAATVVAGEKLPPRLPRVLATAPAKNSGEPSLLGSAGISADDGAAKAVSSDLPDLPRLTPSGEPLVQRTQELVSLQVMQLREAGADVLRVVIKPEAGLRLSLDIQQHGGSVEVRAVLDRGNFDLLNRHWPELQQQLESRGVRVAPLVNADQTSGDGGEGFRQPTTSHGQPAGDDADPAATPVAQVLGLPTATATVTATASASRISSYHLETWA